MTYDRTSAIRARPQQTDDLGVGAGGMDLATFQCLFSRPTWDWEDARHNWIGPGRVPGGLSDQVLYSRGFGESFGRSSKALHVGSLLEPTRQARLVDRGRAGLFVVPPRGSGVAVPSLRGPLRTPQPADHEQPGVQRLGADSAPHPS